MESLSIVQYPHPALRWKSKPILEINSQVRDVVRQMFTLLYESRGVGLAANQVGLPWRLFIVNPTGDPAESDQELVFINPEIVRRKGSEEDEEGCLSFPKLYLPVRRSKQIAVEAFGLDGTAFRMDLDDFFARIIQHEYDHLEGTLFVDRVSDADRDEILPQLADWEDEFRAAQDGGEIASDDALEQQLRQLEPVGPR